MTAGTELTAGATTVGYDPATARLTVRRDGRTLAAGEIRVAVDGRPVPLEPGDVVETDATVRVRHDAGERGIETAVALAPADAGGAVDATVAVTNRSDEPVRVDGFRPLAGAETPFGPDDRVFEHGYQSWTPTGTLPLAERFPPEPPENRPQMCDPAAPEDGRTSHYVIALDGDPGPLSLGFLDHSEYLSRFDVGTGAEGTRLSAVCPADGVELAPGERRESSTLRVDATRDPADALAALAGAVGDRMDARVPATAPTGWCSWYHYFTDVTAADVRENVAALDDWGLPVDVVQVDDGYETAFGDWLTLDSGFADMGRLRAEIADAGYTPGLWLAPFYVQADSDLAGDHPEWLVTRDGDPVDAGPRHGPMYGLDTTHPGALDWLRDTFATVVDEWGFEYLKLDFLYAAALPGERHADVTRATAYRRGLGAIREAVGDDAFVLGCGAPAFPSVGLVDAMRVGPDTAPYWRREDEPASEPAHENAVRNVLNRDFCHRRLWVNDPDCQLVRESTALTDAERRAFAALVALTGGSNVFSDAIPETGAGGRRLLERTLPPGPGGRVEGVGEAEFPDRVVSERPADGARAVAAFNWADEPRTVVVDPGARVDGDAARAWDAFDRRPVGSGPVSREVDAHDVLLVHCAPARDRPHLLGADHLGNAVGQVTGVAWETDGDPGAGTGTGADGPVATGTLTVEVDAREAVDLVAVAPGGWRRAGGGAGTGTETGADDRIVELVAEPGRTAVPFERVGER